MGRAAKNFRARASARTAYILATALYRVEKSKKEGPMSVFPDDAFILASADNLDYTSKIKVTCLSHAYLRSWLSEQCWWLLHTQNCVKLHHTQIHHGGNGMKCDFPTREVEISTSFFTV